jgi:hypothetical protein
MMFVPDRKDTYGSPQPVNGDSVTVLYVDDIHTPQETLLWTSAACYKVSFTVLYVDDVAPHRK